MLKKILKAKRYYVIINYKEKVELVETGAYTKKQARKIVNDILLNCDLFNVKSSKDFKLEVFRKRGN